jgi:hypothetical protein
MISGAWTGYALMLFAAGKTPSSILSVALIACTFGGTCAVDVVIVKGRVDLPPGNAVVRVQLVYAKEVAGESGEATIENGGFNIPIEFLTQSRRPVVNGLLEKCSRRPKTVIVKLLEGDHEYDSVSLDFAKDFKMADSSAYTLRSALVLNRPH